VGDSGAAARVVIERPGRFGTAELIPDDACQTGWTVAANGVAQSYVDLADPAYLRMNYLEWIAQTIDRHWPSGDSISAVFLGGAGCTLPRYVAATRPGSAQTVYELDGPLIDLVRDHLDLDGVPGLRVHVMDGRVGIEGIADATVDLVVVDVFRGGDVAADLATVEFLREIARVLRPGGLYAVNLWDAADLDFALRAVASVCAVFPHVVTFVEARVLVRTGPGNVVVAASTVDLPTARLAAWAATTPNQVRCLTPPELTTVCGPATPLTETDPLATPITSVRPSGSGSRFV
jgi:spermidine synthase